MQMRRRLTAVLIADVVGYSRLMSLDEEGTHLRLLNFVKASIEPAIAVHFGRLIRTAGDGFLCEFDSAVDAVNCALDIEDRLTEPDIAADRRLRFRIGINTGDVIVEDREIYGNIVNIAARLEELAQPGEICISRSVREQLRGRPGLSFVDRGVHRVKNVVYPIRVYRVARVPERAASTGITGLAHRIFRSELLSRHRTAAVTAGLLALTAVVTVGALPFRLDYSQVSPRASIMVLPFRNASGNSEEDYVADAITDDLTTDLSRLSNTSVISPATAFTFGRRPSIRGRSAENLGYVTCCRAVFENPGPRCTPTPSSSTLDPPSTSGPTGSKTS